MKHMLQHSYSVVFRCVSLIVSHSLRQLRA